MKLFSCLNEALTNSYTCRLFNDNQAFLETAKEYLSN